MKILYLNPWNMSEDGLFAGPAKKTKSFITALINQGIDVTLINDIKFSSNNKLITRLPYTAVYSYIDYEERFNGYDVYYIRFFGSDYKITKLLKQIKKNNKKAKIILEFPDIDYMSHFNKDIKNIPFFLKDKFFTKKLHQYVDRIVIMGNNKTMYGVKCIKIYNGVDVQNIVIKNDKQINKNEIHFGCVASIQPVHGIDIFLNAMSQYYKNGGKRKVLLEIAGGGPSLDSLKKLTETLDLSEYVKFYGFLYNDELDDFYNKIDIGLCELAPFRRGFELSSSLKSREYLAKGLPIISGAKIDIFEDYPFEYFKKIEVKNEKIDLMECVDFFDKVYTDDINSKGVNMLIREYAFEHVDMNKTVKPVVDYLEINNQ